MVKTNQEVEAKLGLTLVFCRQRNCKMKREKLN